MLDDPALSDDTAGAVLDVLEPVAESAADWDKLVVLLGKRAELQQDDFEKSPLYARAAEIQEQNLDQAEAALGNFGKALKFDPSNLPWAEDIARIAEARGLQVKGAQALVGALPAHDHPSYAELLLRAGQLLMAPELDAVNLTRARKLFQRLLQADPENGDALNALEEVYRRQGENQKLALVLEKRAEGSYDGDTRRDALLSAARAHQETGNPDAAIASLETLRTSGEADDEALDLLMGLLSARGKTAELVEVLEEACP